MLTVAVTLFLVPLLVIAAAARWRPHFALLSGKAYFFLAFFFAWWCPARQPTAAPALPWWPAT